MWTSVAVGSPNRPACRALAGAFPRRMQPAMLGVVQATAHELRFGPLTLLRFGPPEAEDGAFSWPIRGGVLAAAPGGRFRLAWADGTLIAAVEAYRPRLPRWLYLRLQAPFHRAVTRQFLLALRGRVPGPGMPAEPVRRAAAATLDLAAIAVVVRALAGRKWLHWLLPAAAVYHFCFWWRGFTPGGRLLDLALVAVDGSPPGMTQALFRLVGLPLCLRGARTRHDELAGTDVVLAQAGRITMVKRLP